jgi:thiol-disulfide isomerase/thioredoxin
VTPHAPPRLALVLAVGAALAPACGRGFSPRVDDPSGAAEQPCAAALAVPRPAAAAPPPAAPGPGYTLMDLAAINREVRGRGRPVLLHFWASWCGPCLEELPLVDRFARDMKGKGVDVVSLSLDDPQRAGARVVEVLSARAPNLTRNIAKLGDSDAFINAIDPRWEGSIPAVFAFDDHGRLRDRLIGEASRSDLDGLAAKVSRK